MNLVFRNNHQNGFTLMEVLISIVILSIISLSIYQATQSTNKVRETLTQYGDFYNGIRLGMSIIEKDISMIYSPQMQAEKKTSPTPDPNNPNPQPTPTVDTQELLKLFGDDAIRETTFWGPVEDLTGMRPSRFRGQSESVKFISASHVRIYKDSPESIFSRITYALRTPESSTEEGKVLVKTEDTNVFDTNDDHGDERTKKEYILLTGIQKFSLRYYRRDKDQWINAWDNEKDDIRNKFPDLIEITLNIKGPQRLEFDGKFVFKPEIPINGIKSSI